MTTPDIYRDAEYITDVFTTPPGASDYEFQQDDGRVEKAQSNAKIMYIDRLLRDLDILIYCELSALYYMDCSLSLFLVRAIIQLIFFTPKAPPFDPTRNQPFVGGIFASNIFCMIYHYCFTNPEVSEATRGYLHGGLFIDFIGQKAPVSVVRLLSFDLLVMFIDLVMLGLVVERVKMVESAIDTTASAPSAAETEQQQQDHDSEERGILRQNDEPTASPPSGQETGDGIELDELSHNAHTHYNGSIDERTELLADPSESHATEHSHTKPTHPLDTFSSGEYMLMDLGLLDVIRDQWRYSPSSSSPPSPRRTTSTNPSNPTTSRYAPSPETAAFLRTRFGLQVSADGRVERVQQ